MVWHCKTPAEWGAQCKKPCNATQDTIDAASGDLSRDAGELDAMTVSFSRLPPTPRTPHRTAPARADRSAYHESDLTTLGRHPPLPLAGPSLRRQTLQLLGREREVDWVAKSLRQHGTTVVWGAPGEGKTSVAMEAACRLQEANELLLAVVIDLKGVQCAGPPECMQFTWFW